MRKWVEYDYAARMAGTRNVFFGKPEEQGISDTGGRGGCYCVYKWGMIL